MVHKVRDHKAAQQTRGIDSVFQKPLALVESPRQKRRLRCIGLPVLLATSVLMTSCASQRIGIPIEEPQKPFAIEVQQDIGEKTIEYTVEQFKNGFSKKHTPIEEKFIDNDEKKRFSNFETASQVAIEVATHLQTKEGFKVTYVDREQRLLRAYILARLNLEEKAASNKPLIVDGELNKDYPKTHMFQLIRQPDEARNILLDIDACLDLQGREILDGFSVDWKANERVVRLEAFHPNDSVFEKEFQKKCPEVYSRVANLAKQKSDSIESPGLFSLIEKHGGIERLLRLLSLATIYEFERGKIDSTTADRFSDEVIKKEVIGDPQKIQERILNLLMNLQKAKKGNDTPTPHPEEQKKKKTIQGRAASTPQKYSMLTPNQKNFHRRKRMR
ncbi:MAG: hypothetical protein ABH950_05625 [Candidatus Altiarchaeota archaeon]